MSVVSTKHCLFTGVGCLEIKAVYGLENPELTKFEMTHVCQPSGYINKGFFSYRSIYASCETIYNLEELKKTIDYGVPSVRIDGNDIILKYVIEGKVAYKLKFILPPLEENLLKSPDVNEIGDVEQLKQRVEYLERMVRALENDIEMLQ